MIVYVTEMRMNGTGHIKKCSSFRVFDMSFGAGSSAAL
jgi:hypothetical protein